MRCWGEVERDASSLIAKTVLVNSNLLETSMLIQNYPSAGAGTKRAWSADQVERWPIERLIPCANNARLY
jgi:hypothetical protein